MFLNRRLTLILLQVSFTIFCESKTPTRKDKRLFALLGYLHGYKIGYDYALQLPPIVPVIVIPTINQHQSVTILKTYNDVNKSENQIDLKAALPVKDSVDTNEINVGNESKEVNSLKLIQTENVIEEPNDTLRQAINTTVEKTTTETSTLQTQDATEVSTQLNVTEVSNNKTVTNTTENPLNGYPTAMYNNDFVTSIQLTTETDEATGLPPIDDNRWQNFTTAGNSTQTINNNQTTTHKGGPYSAALYNNEIINNLVLTTKPYGKDPYLPPAQDERWKNFSSETLYENSGQFKPLAGLYYDGFLHRPLTKVGFVPRPNYIF